MNSPFPDRLAAAGRLLIYFFIIVLPAANAPITGDTLEIKAHLFRLLGFAAALLHVSIALLRTRSSEPSTRTGPDGIDLAVLLGAAGVVASLAGSESRLASLPGAMDAAASLAFLCLARSVFAGSLDRGTTPPILVVVGLSSVLPAVLFVAEQQRIGISDTLGNQNVVSQFLLLTLCAPIYVLLRSASTLRKAAAAIFLLALLSVIWLTAARGAVVGILVSLSVMAGLSAVRYWKTFGAPLKIAAVAACVILVLLAPALLYRYSTMNDFNVSVRFLSWSYSISLLSDRLWFGYGPGLFATSFEKTKLWMSDPDSALLGHLTVNYAHNDYVELAVEQGAFGLAAFLFLIGMCMGPAAWRWIRPADPEDTGRSARMALMAGLIASLVQAFFDFPYHIPATRLLFYVLLGLISPPRAADAGRVDPPMRARGWSWASVLLVLTLLPAFPVLTVFAASMISNVADPQFKAGRYDAVRHLHEWAGQLDPAKNTYPFRKGLGEELAGDFENAGRSFRAALSHQPYFPNLYFHLGTISLKDDPVRAATAFYSTLAFGTTSVALHNLAAMGLALGDSPAAAALYTEIARRYPDDAQARRNADVLRRPEGQEKPESYRRAFEIYQQGRYDLAEPLADRYRNDFPEDPDGLFLYGRILFHRGRQEESARYFKMYVSRVPGDAEGHYYLGNVHFLQQRHAESMSSFLQASRLNPGSPKIHYNLGVNYYLVGDIQSMNDCFDTVLSINPNVSTRPKIEELRRVAAAGREGRSP